MIIAVKQLLNNEHALCFNILFHYWLVLALFFISYLFQFFSLILVFFTPVIFRILSVFSFNSISILTRVPTPPGKSWKVLEFFF